MTPDTSSNIVASESEYTPAFLGFVSARGASREDVRRFYNFFLRREPENDEVQLSRTGRPISELVSDFLNAEEFQRRVCVTLRGLSDGPSGYFFGRPSLELIAWATTNLGMSPRTASEISSARTWARIDLALLRDEVVWAAMSPNLKSEFSLARAEGLQLLERADNAFDIVGCLDIATPALVAGWCCDCGDLENKVSVEIYIDTELVGNVLSSGFRSDLRDSIGGDGRFGFSLSISKALGSLFRADRWILVREVTSRRLLGKIRYKRSEIGDLLSSADDPTQEEYVQIADLYRKQLASSETPDTAFAGRQIELESETARETHGDDPLFGILIDAISRSGLFDAESYKSTYEASIPAGMSPLHHYLSTGEALGFRPNLYFCPQWYSRKYRSNSSSSGALLHYIEVGERAGNKPVPIFEPRWYLETYKLYEIKTSLLCHYLENRRTNLFNPNRFFDIVKYINENPDIRRSDIDAFWHWVNTGIFEGRRGSDKFDAEFVWRQYLGNNRELNPFEIFMDIGIGFGWEPIHSPIAKTVYSQVAANVKPGPLFEDLGQRIDLPSDAPKIVALYLPQFHAIPENDLWWGNGFTEWRNVARGLPRFDGHIQPRIPRDLGFYTLDGTNIIRRQVEIAKHSGIHGFCFYYYNFNGKRLLERPLEAFLAEKEINFPFCIMWANENWSRRWDGSDNDLLIRQDYREEDLGDLIDDIARHMKDFRYMRTPSGRPLFFVYRADSIAGGSDTIIAWRERFRSAHALDPLIIMAQTFGVDDPRPSGFDGAMEFPPHKLAANLPRLNASLRILDPDFDGVIRAYAGVVQESLKAPPPPFPLIKTAFPSWDNDARRQGHGMVIANSTPKAFQEWTRNLLNYAIHNKFHGDSFVFINAWNEWCEGAYLEPDTHFGYAYLNAVGRALQSVRSDPFCIVLVGHDAFPSGAQHLLLHLGTLFARTFGMRVRFALIGGGEMVPRYREIGETFVAADAEDPWRALRDHLADLRTSGFGAALVNTVAAGGSAEILQDLGFRFAGLVHELPTFLRSNALTGSYSDLTECATALVYPSRYVKVALDRAFSTAERATIVRPQGLYHLPDIPPDASTLVREEFGLDPVVRIVLNVGYADLRKGVDLFVGLAEQVSRLDPDVHFVWVGGLHPDISPWLDLDLKQRRLYNVHFVPFTQAVGRYLGAADLFLLTSREDPFPSVVLEALAAGLPVAAFENSGGHVELIESDPRLGAILPFGASPEGARRVVELLDADRTEPGAAHRRTYVEKNYDFAEYGADLLRLAMPHYHTVSVIVPSYNYARYIKERLHSIFAQCFLVFEVIVIDDASNDDSLEVAAAVAAQARRKIRLQGRKENSGNVFRQWKAGLDLARGDFIWIAEADDSSEPEFLRELLRVLADDPDAAFGFTDSRAMGSDGSILYDSYKEYYHKFGDHGLDQDGRFEGTEFLRRFLTIRNLVMNVSSVLWRADALRRAFASLGEEAFALICAGDWRLYVEVCRQAKAVHYIAAPLNWQRRHNKSVTETLDKRLHFEEVVRVQEIALVAGGGGAELAENVAAFRKEIRELWGL